MANSVWPFEIYGKSFTGKDNSYSFYVAKFFGDGEVGMEKMSVFVPYFPCCWRPPVLGLRNGQMGKLLGQKPKCLTCPDPQY